MSLSPEQIQVLFDFTKKKYVHFYDLQSEIVDHLAAAIEDKMSKNKNLSFRQALEEVYSGFGIFGFAHVVREKEKQIDRMTLRMLWKEVLFLFTWPHLLFSMLILASLYTLSQIFSIEVFAIITLLVLVSAGSVYFYKTIKSPKPSKVLRMMNYYQPIFSFIPYIYAQLILNFNTINSSSYTIFTFVSIIYLIASYRVNAKVKSNAMALYPEAFASEISN